MRHRRQSQSTVEIALSNFALTFAKALLVFCVALFLLISPKEGKDGTKPHAEYLLTANWSSGLNDDVDLWTRLPDGNRVNFHNKESGIVFLERDDLGQTCQATTVAGQPPGLCEEIVTLRGIVPGAYAVALHLFSANSVTTPGPAAPASVTVKIEKLNPTTAIVWQAVVILDQVRQEKGVIRFTMLSDGTITDIETDDIPHFVYEK